MERSIVKRRHHVEEMSRPPLGLVVLGDALCRVNPVSGQGMSVAAHQAVALLEVLREEPGERLARRFRASGAARRGALAHERDPGLRVSAHARQAPANLCSLLQWKSDMFNSRRATSACTASGSRWASCCGPSLRTTRKLSVKGCSPRRLNPE
jgi:hypothetical protein